MSNATRPDFSFDKQNKIGNLQDAINELDDENRECRIAIKHITKECLRLRRQGKDDPLPKDLEILIGGFL